MNILDAKIISLQSTSHTILVTVEVTNGVYFDIVLLKPFDIAVDEMVSIGFKSSMVVLFKSQSHITANCAKGVLKEIEKGEIFTNITIKFGDSDIDALVLSKYIDDFSIDEEIYFGIQPNEISIIKSLNE